MTELRVGLCGTGYWARQTWAPALTETDGVTLAGVWGRNRQRAAAMAEDFGIRAYESVAGLVESVDAVAVCLPPDVQPTIATAAAQAGCHLLLEKPLALGVPEANLLRDEVDRSGVASVVLFTGRFVPQIRDWIVAARNSRAMGAHGVWLGAPFAEDSPYRESAWRRQHGALWDVGPHLLAAILPVLGPVEPEPSGVTATRGPGDTVHLALRHTTGASSALTMSFAIPPAAARLEAAFWGPGGWSPMPDGMWDARRALHGAIATLLEQTGTVRRPAATGEELDPSCDVRFAAEVVSILARTQSKLPPPGPGL